jgi:hypothetical protein
MKSNEIFTEHLQDLEGESEICSQLGGWEMVGKEA